MENLAECLDDRVEKEPPYLKIEDGLSSTWTPEELKERALPESQSPLDLYLSSISIYPILSSEKQLELARRYKNGDADAGQKLVETNLRFVVSRAFKYARNRNALEHVMDLIQEGNDGLLNSRDKFDPDKGTNFLTYANNWIRQRIIFYLNTKPELIRPSHTYSSKHKKIWARIDELQENGLEKNQAMKRVCEEEGISFDRWKRHLQTRNSKILSLDTSLFKDDDLHEIVRPNHPVSSSDEKMYLDESIRLTSEALKILTERERTIIHLYYGLDGEEELTLEEIGGFMGVGRERIRQLRDRGLDKLRQGEMGRVLRELADL